LKDKDEHNYVMLKVGDKILAGDLFLRGEKWVEILESQIDDWEASTHSKLIYRDTNLLMKRII